MKVRWPTNVREIEGPRTVVSSVRWSPSEWETVRFEADRYGLRPASYIRQAALGEVAFVPRSPRARRQRFSTPRSVRLKVRLHPEELARLERMAVTLSMPVATFVRDAAVGYQIASRADAETIRHLARIGQNLNQLTRHANTIRRIDTAERLDGTLRELRRVLDSLT